MSLAADREAYYSLAGLWCPGCGLAIEHRLGRLPGILEVGVDYAGAILRVVGEAEAIRLAALAPAVARLGYRLLPLEAAPDAEARLDAESRRLAGRLLVAALFGMWTMLASLLIYAGALPEPRLERVLAWASGAFALPVVLHAGIPFYRAAWRTLRAGRPGMDLLVSLGVAGAMAVSLWLLWQGSAEVYFDTAVMLILLLLAGRWLELLARYRGLRALAALLPAQRLARVKVDGAWQEVAAGEVASGQRIRIAPGATVPLDGELLDAEARLDLSPLTGESRPVRLTRGEVVAAGAHNRGRTIQLRVMARAGECRMDRLQRDMRRLQAGRGAMRQVTERFAAWLSPLALGLSLVSLGGLLLAGVALEEALVRALSVLVVACPCAVGLAVPLASLAGTARALEQGVAFRDPAALELAGRVRSVAFDKTGTLAGGELTVAEVVPAPGVDPTTLLGLAALAEQGSEHPVGQAIRRRALDMGLLPETAPLHVEECPGRGRTVRQQGQVPLRIGSPAWLGESGLLMPAWGGGGSAAVEEAMPVTLACGDTWLGTLWLRDAPDPDALPLMTWLKGWGLAPLLISGDRSPLVWRIAQDLGLSSDACFAGRGPEQKRALVAALPRPSLYVGDGINDAPALAAASVGVAPLAASQAAREAAAIQLLRPGPGGVRQAMQIARLTHRVMRQNLMLAVFYNALALPLVAVMPIPPLAAVLTMALSSLSVLGNAARLSA